MAAGIEPNYHQEEHFCSDVEDAGMDCIIHLDTNVREYSLRSLPQFPLLLSLRSTTWEVGTATSGAPVRAASKCLPLKEAINGLFVSKGSELQTLAAILVSTLDPWSGLS